MMKKILVQWLVPVGVLSVSALTAAAQETWSGAAGDRDWFNPLNWSTGTVPIASGSTNLTYITTLVNPPNISAGAAQATNLEVGTQTSSGSLTINGSGSLVVDYQTRIGYSYKGNLLVTDSGYFSTKTMQVGFGSTGLVEIIGSGTLNTTDSILLGDYGSGTLRMDDHAVLTVSSMLRLASGRGTASSSVATVAGQAFVSATSNINLNQNSSLTLSQSGSILTTNAYIGNDGSNLTTSTLIVSGSASLASRTLAGSGNNGVLIGERGNGMLTLEESGSVTGFRRIQMARSGSTSTGTVNLNGGLIDAWQFIVGRGDGVINANGGTIRVSGTDGASVTNGFFAQDTGYLGTQLYPQVNILDGGLKFDTQNFTAKFNNPLVGASAHGGLVKQGAGTLLLNGINTYTGDTVIQAGTLTLSANASLLFAFNDDDFNAVTGSGRFNLYGAFDIDTDGAGGGSWTLVDKSDGLTVSVDYNTFTVTGWTRDAVDDTLWTLGSDWSFNSETFLLTSSAIIPEPSALALLALALTLLPVLRRCRSK